MKYKFRPLIGTTPSTNFILTWPACPCIHLHMIIHGFVFWNIQNRPMSVICKFCYPCASLVLCCLLGL